MQVVAPADTEIAGLGIAPAAVQSHEGGSRRVSNLTTLVACSSRVKP
jgi:hypothetical protein